MVKARRFEPVDTGGNGVVIGMSGGVDSAAAAWSLRESGFRTVGATLHLLHSQTAAGRSRSGLNGTPGERAKRLCALLGIEHHTIDLRDLFHGAVVEPFIDEYRRGRTPNPCITCNEKIKFPALVSLADRLGCAFIATGHYARLVRPAGGRPLLATAADLRKDQSYFLYRVPVNILERTVFPVGGLTKTDVRRIASQLGMETSASNESQDVCFLAGTDLESFLSEKIAPKPGEVTDTEGRVLGSHGGVFRYTVGQRRGLGIARGVPLYVSKIDAGRSRVVVSEDVGLYAMGARVGRLRLRKKTLGGPLTAKIRYRHPPASVKAVTRGSGRLEVDFLEPQRAVTPGQSLVLYRENVVVGGGIIECVLE